MSRGVLILMAVIGMASATTADEIAVTVYNSNLGVISEVRTLEFDKGAGRLAFRDVPSQIDATSVQFELVDPGKAVTILEQNYAFDLVSPDKIYEKYVDQEIELIAKEGQLFSGQLLAYSGGAVTLRDKAGKIKILTLANISETNFPSLPEGLITRPTLFWNYQSDFDGSTACRVGYQTAGMNWAAEYVGLLDSKDTQLGLSGWSSINNMSGKTYQDAKLKLVAGDIHRAPTPREKGVMMEADRLMVASAGFEEKAFFEYHMYTLPRPATLANNEIKQISLFEPATAQIKKIYLYKPDYNSRDVSVKVEFANSREAGLGMPLPAGRVRVFKADDDGSMILVGEDRIDHTPKDEKVSLTIGTAFDIAAEEKLVQQSLISKQVEEREWAIELRNRKNEDVTITVEKSLWGFWEVMSANLPYEQKDANTLVFQVPVEANTTATISLKVRFTNR